MQHALSQRVSIYGPLIKLVGYLLWSADTDAGKYVPPSATIAKLFRLDKEPLTVKRG